MKAFIFQFPNNGPLIGRAGDQILSVIAEFQVIDIIGMPAEHPAYLHILQAENGHIIEALVATVDQVLFIGREGKDTAHGLGIPLVLIHQFPVPVIYPHGVVTDGKCKIVPVWRKLRLPYIVSQIAELLALLQSHFLAMKREMA